MSDAQVLRRARAILACGVFTEAAILEAADYLRAMGWSPNGRDTEEWLGAKPDQPGPAKQDAPKPHPLTP